MCFGTPQQQPTTTPSAAPAPAAPNPIPQDIGDARKADTLSQGGNADGSSNTRVDRSLDIPAGGSGLNM